VIPSGGEGQSSFDVNFDDKKGPLPEVTPEMADNGQAVQIVVASMTTDFGNVSGMKGQSIKFLS